VNRSIHHIVAIDGKRLILRLFVVILLLSGPLRAGDTLQFQMPQVVVTSSKFALSPAEMNRSVVVIDSSLLSASSPASIDEALQTFTTTELRRRGTLGVQTDIGIRGSTFSQQAILLNGIRINDPQTAHHNFDIPISMDAVKQIEIIRGPSSSHFGPDASGGIVNIITSNEHPGTTVGISGGAFGYRGGDLSAGFTAGTISSLNSLHYERSDGYRYDTEAENFSFMTSNSVQVNETQLHLLSGYSSKDFGAFDFYSPGSNIPSHEKTESIVNTLGIDFSSYGWNFTSHVSYRHHFDHFVFTINNPSLSNNVHNTNVYIADLNGSRALTPELLLTSSAEMTTDNINSTNLGIHSRTYGAFSSVIRWIPLPSFSLDAGFRADAHSDYGTQFHPILNAGYFVFDHAKIYVSAGTSFRSPSYTDLYYRDPKTVGNINLKPERGSSIESGIFLQPYSAWTVQVSGFYRHQNNLIDYIQDVVTYGDSLFHADNFTESTTRGLEFQSSWFNTGTALFLKNIFIGYTYLASDVNRKSAIATRYSLTHPDHQLNGALLFEFPSEVWVTIGGVFLGRKHAPDQSNFDLTVKKNIHPFDVILKATNLFNRPYQEIPGIPLPGRWMIGKISWNIF
jgi:iron complex outermembrane receptor protein